MPLQQVVDVSYMSCTSSLVGEAAGKQAHAVHSPACQDHLKAFPWLLLKAQEFTQGRPLTMYGPEASLMLLQEQLYAF